MATLEDVLAALVGETPDVSVHAGELTRNGVVFAARPDFNTVELNLGAEIADAAARTPAAGPSARGAGWITFAPPDWDQHAIDRLEAWFRVAWRFAAGSR